MPKIIACILFLYTIGCSLSNDPEREALLTNARKYLPDEHQKEVLIQALETRDFDPEINLIRAYLPSTASRYHSAMVDTLVHPLRESARYASDLLDTGVPEYLERAFNIFEKVIEHQDQDKHSNTYGVWPYYYEESLEQMPIPDSNWADFIVVPLLEAYMKHHQILPGTLKTTMEKAIIHAGRSVQKRDVQPGYTNIALMGTLVTYLTARLFDIPKMKVYADKRLERFYQYTVEMNGFEEYNSPIYTMVALNVLVQMKQYVLDLQAKKMIDHIYEMGWDMLSSHFHPRTGQLAGPHSRSYSSFLREDFYDVLYAASNRRIKYKNAQAPYQHYKLRHRIPESMLQGFIETGHEKVKVDTFGTGNNPVTGYTYLHPHFCIGTANRSTTWQQRRPLLAYWGTSERPDYFRSRLLRNFVDFAAGNIFSVQDKSNGLTALNFATDGGDYHLLFDRLEEGKFEAKDLRLRFEFGGAGLFDKISIKEENLIRLEDDEIRLDIKLLYAKFGDENITITKDSNGETCWVDLIIHSGENKSFDLRKTDHAVFAWAFSMHHLPDGQSGILQKAETVLQDGWIHVKWEEMKLSVPVAPNTEQYLQRNYSTSHQAVQ